MDFLLRMAIMGVLVGGYSLPVASQPSPASQPSFEYYQLNHHQYVINTDRPGNDYHDFALSRPEPEICAKACYNDNRCAAWAYAKHGVHGPQAHCWLKNPVPKAYVRDDCCVSGIKEKASGID